MKKIFIFFTFYVSIMYPISVFGENAKLESPLLNEENTIVNPENNIQERHFQDRILSDPETNAAARVGIQDGGNTAIINQNGISNYSSIVQSGNNNHAAQTQKGNENEIYLEQKGVNNRHIENQAGDHNKKVIIQNETEAIIRQVSE